MTRLSLIRNLLKQSGHPTARSPFSVSPSGPPNDLVHVITTRAVELATNDNNCGVEIPGFAIQIPWEQKVQHNTKQCFLFLLPQSYIRLLASRTRTQIFSSQLPMAGYPTLDTGHCLLEKSRIGRRAYINTYFWRGLPSADVII